MNASATTMSVAFKPTAVYQRRWPLVVCAVLLICSMTIASSLGAVTLPFATTARLLAKGIAGLPFAGEERAQAAIIYLIRFPRVLTAARSFWCGVICWRARWRRRRNCGWAS